jgi:predicted ArsR family transcriptional regulator
MAIGELAAAVGLHPNTAREHLDRLIEAGLVVSDAAPPSGRGRPSLRYRASAASDDEGAFRDLAAVLADELSRRPDAPVAAVRAGERWGHAAASTAARSAAFGPTAAGSATGPPRTRRETARAAVERLVDLLDDAGYAPERPVAGDGVIRLRRCPFGDLAGRHREVVCGVHLGLMRGVLAELDAPFDDVSLQPFVEPDLCVARVRR